MMPPVYALLTGDTQIMALISDRVYPFGEARQDGAYPYVTWQILTAIPENTLSCTPQIDGYLVQVDVWAKSVTDALAVAEAVRNRLEPSAHMTAFGDTTRTSDTRAYRYRMDFQFWVSR